MDNIGNDIAWMLNEIGREITILFTISEFQGGDVFSDKVEKQSVFRYADGKKPRGFRYDRRKDFSNADKRRDWLLANITFAIDNVYMLKEAYVESTFDNDDLTIGDETVTLSGTLSLDDLASEINSQTETVVAYSDDGELVILSLSPFLDANKTDMIVGGSASIIIGINGEYQNAEYNFIYDGKEWDITESDEGEYKVSYKIRTLQ